MTENNSEARKKELSRRDYLIRRAKAFKAMINSSDGWKEFEKIVMASLTNHKNYCANHPIHDYIMVDDKAKIRDWMKHAMYVEAIQQVLMIPYKKAEAIEGLIKKWKDEDEKLKVEVSDVNEDE